MKKEHQRKLYGSQWTVLSWLKWREWFRWGDGGFGLGGGMKGVKNYEGFGLGGGMEGVKNHSLAMNGFYWEMQGSPLKEVPCSYLILRSYGECPQSGSSVGKSQINRISELHPSQNLKSNVNETLHLLQILLLSHRKIMWISTKTFQWHGANAHRYLLWINS